MKKKITALFLALCLCFSSSMAIQPTSTETFDEERATLQAAACQQYDNLLNHFSTEDGTIVYPEYYAGAFVNDDSLLVVKVTDSSDAVLSQIKAITQNDNIITEQATYSYNQLASLQNEIADYSSSSQNTLRTSGTIVSVAIWEQGNKVEVGVTGLNDQAKANIIDNFETYSSTTEPLPLVIKEATPIELTGQTKTYAGDIAYGNKKQLSIGFPCSAINAGGQRKYGFVTAWHCASAGSVFNENDQAIGSVIKTAKDVDASFVALTNDYTLPTTIPYSPSEIEIVGKTYAAEGADIYKYGAVTFLTSGTVYRSSTVFNVYDDNVFQRQMTDCVATTAYNFEGDSGGVFFTRPSIYSAHVTGMTEGYSTTGGTYSIYVKVNNILPALDASFFYPDI